MTPTIALLDAARRNVDATAQATIKATKRPRKKLAHIDAASHLMTAALELFGVAEDIAQGKPVRGHGAKLGPEAGSIAVGLRIAEAKIAEAVRMLAQAEVRREREALAGGST